jgi:isopentenyl diphosphate isomerase/L-lactate dehydrogenase-like FMN-dependent dehydrogenase
LAYCLSSAGSCSIEDVGDANGNGPRFFQLYQSPDDEVCISMLQRAWDSGFDACLLTTDTWSLAWRHNDVFTGTTPFTMTMVQEIWVSMILFFKSALGRPALIPRRTPKRRGKSGSMRISGMAERKRGKRSNGQWNSGSGSVG